jgi:glycine/D-amino acid oxidase-like deaminating enzyme
MNISVWEKESFYETCDVLIAGAGLLALWTAIELKITQPKLKVTLIDKSPVPCGASTRNAGFACFGSPTEMINDLEVMGAGAMWSIVEMRYRGIKKILQTFSPAQTGYEPLGGFECYTEGQFDKNFLLEQLAIINAGMRFITGDEHSFEEATGKLESYKMTGFSMMLENRYEGGIHSGRYVESLTNYVRSLGVKIINGLELVSFESEGTGVLVRANQPAFAKATAAKPVNFSARQLLLATNAYLWKQAPQLGVVPARGQIIVSPPVKNLALRGTFHFDAGYYYFRSLGNRVLIGGARNSDVAGEETLELETTDAIKNILFRFLQAHVPQAGDFNLDAFESWSGLMAMHPNKQPLMESIAENAWAAMCCNGMGVALTPVYAEHVAATIFNALQ